MKILKMSLELILVHFILCRLPLILLGQAEQCLLGVQVSEVWKGILEIKLIDLIYFKNKT